VTVKFAETEVPIALVGGVLWEFLEQLSTLSPHKKTKRTPSKTIFMQPFAPVGNQPYSQGHKEMKSLTAFGVRTLLSQSSTISRTAFHFHWLEYVDERKYLQLTTL
jgi:hypothetical protein